MAAVVTPTEDPVAGSAGTDGGKGTVVLRDVTIRNCVFRRLASGIWTNSPDNFNKNAGSIYNFGTFTIGQAKAHMAAAGIPVRLS